MIWGVKNPIFGNTHVFFSHCFFFALKTVVGFVGQKNVKSKVSNVALNWISTAKGHQVTHVLKTLESHPLWE